MLRAACAPSCLPLPARHSSPPSRAAQALESSPTKPWIILHQGNQLIPYINYPFLELKPLRDYIRKAHAVGAKVKLYYTVRELSTSATELWALRALGVVKGGKPDDQIEATLARDMFDSSSAP